MRHTALLVIALTTLVAAIAPPAGAKPRRGDWQPVYHPRLEIRRAAGPIVVDGRLDDAGWRGAAVARNFAEHNPGDQTRPAVDTEVWIAYDDENLYVAWLCEDDPAEVRGYLCERDNIFSGDYVALNLDTYGDGTHAYEIVTNPCGVPGDLLYSSMNGEDMSYDMIFETAAAITGDGWVAEMSIPFESLRFPRREEQVWRVDFWRNRPRESRYQYSWAAYDRDEACWPCQWGTLTGILGVEPGGGFELLPSVVAYQSGSLGEDGEFRNDDVDGDLSLGLSWDVSSELSVEGTINPDFSQVESDADQIDVNSTFALFYPEKRPFFQEGSDLFDTYISAVYTRSINDPSVAGKLTWRRGSNSLALLSAYDEHSVIILPFEEESRFLENGKSASNILRYRRDLGEQSHVGLVATDRRFDGGGAGTLAGLDAQLRLSSKDKIELQALVSHTAEVDNLALADSAFNAMRFADGQHTAGLDGERFTGHALNVEIERDARDYWAGIEYLELSPTFRADNGFEPSNNKRQLEGRLGVIKRFDEESVLENMSANVNGTRKWNFDGVRKDEWVIASGEIHFRAAQTGIHSYYMRSNERYRGIDFDDIWYAHTCFSTKPSGRLHFGANVNYGHRIARRELVMGKETSFGGWADIRPVDRLLVSLSYSRLYSDDLDTGERLFAQSVFRSTVSVQVNREFSARLVTQYNDRFDTWDVDPLLTYRINSLTVFYIGSTHTYRDLELDPDGREGWTLADRQFFLKLQYLFRI